MRAMPYRVATPSSVTFSEPQLLVCGRTFSPDIPVIPWDYLSSSTLRSTVSLEETAFLESTGLATTDGVIAQMQVDCRATGSRHITNVPLTAGMQGVRLEVAIGPHQVAQELEVTHHVLLDSRDLEETRDLVAFRRGSRLHSDDKVHRFILEGSAPTFPTEAFAFGPVGLPAQAAWKLRFEPESLDEPYLGVVRLLINLEHPLASDLLTGNPSLARSVLYNSILEQLLLYVADQFPDEVSSDFDDDSIGGVLDQLAQLHLGLSLPRAVSGLRDDRAETLGRLQAGTLFLSPGAA